MISVFPVLNLERKKEIFLTDRGARFQHTRDLGVPAIISTVLRVWSIK